MRTELEINNIDGQEYLNSLLSPDCIAIEDCLTIVDSINGQAIIEPYDKEYLNVEKRNI